MNVYFSGEVGYCPMDFTRLAAAGFDYIALGHSHKPHTVCRDKIVYAGALEPQDRNDVGKHGYIEGEFDGESVKLKLRPFALRSYQNLDRNAWIALRKIRKTNNGKVNDRVVVFM